MRRAAPPISFCRYRHIWSPFSATCRAGAWRVRDVAAHLLEMSVRALPHAYAEVPADIGTSITLCVTGETSGAWSLVRAADGWQIQSGRPAAPDVTITIAADDVWRMFYNALSGAALMSRVTVAGSADLAAPLLRARSVMV